MILDVTIQEVDQEYFIGRINLIDSINVLLLDIKTIKIYINDIGGTEWLNISTMRASNEMDNCTKKLIRETEAELVKAKQFLKNKYAIRYKLSYAKVIIKNPLKYIVAKWLLR